MEHKPAYRHGQRTFNIKGLIPSKPKHEYSEQNNAICHFGPIDWQNSSTEHLRETEKGLSLGKKNY